MISFKGGVSSPSLSVGKRWSPFRPHSQRRLRSSTALLRSRSKLASDAQTILSSPETPFASPPQLTVNRRPSPSVLRPRVLRSQGKERPNGSPLRRGGLSELHTHLLQSVMTSPRSERARVLAADREVEAILSRKLAVRDAVSQNQD